MKGIITTETVIALLAYFALAGLLLNCLAETNNKIEAKKNLLSAKGSVMSCTMIADSVYSNSGEKVEIKENCFFEDKKMKSMKGNGISEEKTLTEKITTTTTGIKIGAEDHYR